MPSAPLKLLILEDDDLDYQVLIRHILSHQPPKYDLYRARTIAEADVIIAEHDIEAALVDHSLAAGDSGLDFVKGQGGRECAFPSIILTGSDFGAIEEQIFETGAYDYIEKIAVTRDLIDRTVRFAISAQEYENRMKDAMNDVATQADLNRGTLAVFRSEMQAMIGTTMRYRNVIAECAEDETVNDAAEKISDTVQRIEEFMQEFSELVYPDDKATETPADELAAQG